MQEENLKKLQEVLDELGGFALEKANERIKYNEKDLLNVTYLFMHIMSNLFYDKLERQWIDFDSISDKKWKEIVDYASGMWLEIYEYIKKYTGLDTKAICAKENMEQNAILNYPYLKD